MKNFMTGLFLAITLFGGNTMTQASTAPLPKIDKTRTAVVITDPQNDFLHPKGKLYGLLKENMMRLNTIDNIETLMKTAKQEGVTLAVDPLIYTAIDSTWTNSGTLQRQLLDMKALHAEHANSSKGIEGSGADYFSQFKPYINDGKTIQAAPHKMYGPESNDLIYQLRNRGIDTVILGGLVANLCVDSHMRTLMENGFKVYVVNDAVAAPGEEAYNAALVNYGMIANGVWSTKEAAQVMSH